MTVQELIDKLNLMSYVSDDTEVCIYNEKEDAYIPFEWAQVALHRGGKSAEKQFEYHALDETKSWGQYPYEKSVVVIGQ